MQAKVKTAIYALTPQGAELGSKLSAAMDAKLFLSSRLSCDYSCAASFDSLANLIITTFNSYSSHIFITATGIAVRSIAPHLGSKDRDPAVVVLDQDGKYCISLVSGHLGGANALARNVADITGGTAVITTATDTAGLPAIDELASQLGLVVRDVPRIKIISAALLRSECVQLHDPEDILGLRAHSLFTVVESLNAWNPDLPGVAVSFHNNPFFPGLPVVPENTLVLHSRQLAVGIGCRKGTSQKDILGVLELVFTDNNLALSSIAHLGSATAKQDEPGLLQAAQTLGLDIAFFPSSELDRVPAPNPSPTVQRHVGTASVCEASAMLLGNTETLLVEKTAYGNVTVAVAAINTNNKENPC